MKVELSMTLPSAEETCRPLGLFWARIELISVTGEDAWTPPPPVVVPEMELERKTQF